MKITLNIISVIKQYLQFLSLLGSLSKDVFERRMSIGSEAFSIFICLDADKFVIAKFILSRKDDLPESFNQTTAQWRKKFTSGWLSSLKNAFA